MYRFAVVLLLPCCVVATSAWSDDEVQMSSSSDEVVADLLKATDPRMYGRITRRIFESASEEQLASLEQTENDGVAVQAAWERIRQTMIGPNYITTPIVVRHIDPLLLQRFLGYASGRLRVPLPKWWERRFEELHYLFPGYLGLNSRDLDPKASVAPNMHLIGDSVYPKAIREVKEGANGMEAIAEGRTYNIPKTVVDKQRDRRIVDLIDIAAIGDSAFAVSYRSDRPSRYSLYLINSDSHDVLWETEVFCEDILVPGATGSGFKHFAEIVSDSHGRILVYGACDSSMYIEGFDRKDGKPLFRFSTSY